MNSKKPVVEGVGKNQYRLTFRDGRGRTRVYEVTASSMSIAESERKDPSELVKIERIDPETGGVLGGRYTE
jgi:hypothetical protein